MSRCVHFVVAVWFLIDRLENAALAQRAEGMERGIAR